MKRTRIFKNIALIIVILMVLWVRLVETKAEDEITSSGQCGTSATWEYYEDSRKLVIKGSGQINDFGSNNYPWNEYKSTLLSIEIKDGITFIPAGAFAGCSSLQEITLPFIGSSRTATEYEGVLGWVFGYTNITNKPTSNGEKRYYYHQNTTLLHGSGEYKGYMQFTSSPISTSSSSSVSNVVYIYSASDYTAFLGKVINTTRTTGFVDYAVRKGTSAESGTWQYSGYAADKFDVYYKTSSSATYYSVKQVYGVESYYYNIPASLTKVTITDATKVCDAAFMNCSNIREINLNEEITSIGVNAFRGVNNNSQAQDGFIISGNTLIKYIGTASDVTVPDFIRVIAPSAFENNTSINTVNVPASIRFIGAKAFSGCSHATINIPLPRTAVQYSSDSFTGTVAVNFLGAAQFVNGNDTFKYVIENGTATIVGCTTTSSSITVPTEINGYTVTKIGVRGMENCTSLTSVSIPASIIELDDAAFIGCTGLGTVTIPATCKKIGEKAFYGCTNLTSVTLAEGVLSVGDYAFYNCSKLGEIVIPDTCTSLGKHAFRNCTSLQSATIGTLVEDIGDYAFYNCSSLATIVVGTNVKRIGDFALCNTAIARLTTPYTLTELGEYSIAGCTNLTRVVLRNGFTTIGKGAFKNDRALTTINMVSSISEIGEQAFYGCSSLTSISIPGNIDTIKQYTFGECTSLGEVIINGTLKAVEYGAFLHCNLSSFPFGTALELVGANAFRANKFTNLYLPDSLTYLGNSAFGENPGLVSISFTDGLDTVGGAPFTFGVPDQTVTIRYLDGIIDDYYLYDTDIKHLVISNNIRKIGAFSFSRCTNLSTVSFGNGVEEIDDNAFIYNKRIEEIRLPSSAKTIGNNAFGEMRSLQRVIIPDSMVSIGTDAFKRDSFYSYTDELNIKIFYNNGAIADGLLDNQYMTTLYVDDNIQSVGNNAFSNSSQLYDVSIPDTITLFGNNVFTNDGTINITIRCISGQIADSVFDGKLKGTNLAINLVTNSDIGKRAFTGCTAIKTIISDGSNETIGEYAFSNCTGLQTATIGGANETIGQYAFTNCTSLQTVTIAGNNKLLDKYAFSNCNNLQEVKIDAQTERIEEHAFDTCQSLSNMVLPSSVNYIGSHCFYDCNSMESCNIPDLVSEVLPYTFYGCSSLNDIEMPDSITKIGEYAYYGCSAAKTLHISDHCTEIGEYAFYNCKKVAQILVPDSVEKIGEYAFRSCLLITEIVLGDNVKELGKCAFYDCNALETAILGANITRIEDRLFYGCVNLTDLWIMTEVDYIDLLSLYGADDVLVHIGNYPDMIDFFEENGIMYVVEGSIDYEFKGFVWDGATAKAKYTKKSNPNKTLYYEAHVTYTPTVEPTCETDGSGGITATYASHTESKQDTIPAYGHEFKFNRFEWEDYTAKAIYVCEHNNQHTREYEATVTSEITVTPTCETTGLKVYTASYDGNYETKEEVLPAAHNYQFSRFEWNGYTAKAIYICSFNPEHKVEFDADVTSEITVTPTCDAPGLRVYTATYDGHTSTKEEILIAEHDYQFSRFEWSGYTAKAIYVCSFNREHTVEYTAVVTSEVTVAQTCETDGLRVYTATYEGHEDTKEEILPATGHDYSFVRFDWDENYSATAVYVCSHNENHILRFEANVTSAITESPTCETDGLRVYTATYEGHVDTKEEVLPATGHEYSFVRFDWDENYNAKAVYVCQKDSNHIAEYAASMTHTVIKEATYEEEGLIRHIASYDGHTEMKEEVLPVLSLFFDLHEWVWAEDYSYATAVFVCTTDSSNVMRITDSSPTSTTITEETCEQNRIVKYHATVWFRGSEYSTETENVEVPNTMLGHAYGTATYTWNSDYSQVTARAVCLRNSSHIVTETVNTTKTTTATCETPGVTTYTAVFENPVFNTLTREEEAPALGHDYVFDRFITDQYPALAVFVCTHDENHVISYEATRTIEVIEERTCEKGGVIKYTYSYGEYSLVEYENTQPLGHEWEFESWNWADDASSCYALLHCRNDNSHSRRIDATITVLERVEPTYESDGRALYLATVDWDGTIITSTKEIVLPMLIHMTAPTITTAKISGKGILVEWNEVEGATGYVIYRRAMKSGETNWTVFARWNNTTELSFHDTKVYGGTKYQYGVKAYYGNDPATVTNLGPVGPMTKALVWPKKPGATTYTSTMNTDEGILITWEPVEGATGYVIYRRAWSSTTGGWTTFQRWNNTKDTQWTDTKVYAGTRYQYGVKAYAGNDPKNMNFVGAVGPLKTNVRITTRSIKSLSSSGTTVTVEWDASSLFTGYEILYRLYDPESCEYETVELVRIDNPKTTKHTYDIKKGGVYCSVVVRSYHVFNDVTYYGSFSNEWQTIVLDN